MKFDLREKTRLPIYFTVTCIGVLVVSLSVNESQRLTVMIPLLTIVGGVTGFLHSKHSQEIQLFRELFCEFNKRYNTLNEQLNAIHSRPKGEPLQDADIPILYDYFNLCAEEYMYFAAGCIDCRVWQAWRNGMKHLAKDPEIFAIWKRELATDSYYGFPLDLIEQPTVTSVAE